MYRLGAGITNINNKSQYERTNEWSFTPNLILGYQLSKNQALQLISSYKPNPPSGEQLSSNIVQLVPNIVKQGNPYLKPEYLWKNQLKYSFNNKYFDFNIIALYNNTQSAITEYYSFDQPICSKLRKRRPIHQRRRPVCGSYQTFWEQLSENNHAAGSYLGKNQNKRYRN